MRKLIAAAQKPEEKFEFSFLTHEIKILTFKLLELLNKVQNIIIYKNKPGT